MREDQYERNVYGGFERQYDQARPDHVSMYPARDQRIERSKDRVNSLNMSNSINSSNINNLNINNNINNNYKFKVNPEYQKSFRYRINSEYQEKFGSGIASEYQEKFGSGIASEYRDNFGYRCESEYRQIEECRSDSGCRQGCESRRAGRGYCASDVVVAQAGRRDWEYREYRTRSGRFLSGKRLRVFERLLAVFEYQRNKADAADAWLDFMPNKLTDDLVARIEAGCRREAEERPRREARGENPRSFRTFLSARGWEDYELLEVKALGPTMKDAIPRDLTPEERAKALAKCQELWRRYKATGSFRKALEPDSGPVREERREAWHESLERRSPEANEEVCDLAEADMEQADCGGDCREEAALADEGVCAGGALAVCVEEEGCRRGGEAGACQAGGGLAGGRPGFVWRGAFGDEPPRGAGRPAAAWEVLGLLRNAADVARKGGKVERKEALTANGPRSGKNAGGGEYGRETKRRAGQAAGLAMRGGAAPVAGAFVAGGHGGYLARDQLVQAWADARGWQGGMARVREFYSPPAGGFAGVGRGCGSGVLPDWGDGALHAGGFAGLGGQARRREGGAR